MPIPNKLREARKLNKLTQQEVAHMLGMQDAGQLSNWERGKHYPSMRYFLRLCVIYGVYPHQLYGEVLKEMREEITLINGVSQGNSFQ